jgi:uncharacterized protein
MCSALRRLATYLALTVVPVSAGAMCTGDDLLETMAADKRAALTAAADAVPYSHGILWQAERPGARVILLGTYHLADPRHAAILTRIEDFLPDAAALLVEAGPEEEARLKKTMAEDVGVMINTSGPTLPERLNPEEWESLSMAALERGLPPFMAAKMKPWFVSMMLSMSPCMLAEQKAAGKMTGLDAQLMAMAAAAAVPVSALEPWDTVLTLFAGLNADQELDMLRGSLQAALTADDNAATLANAYFAEFPQLIWEFGRQQALEDGKLSPEAVAAQMDLAEEVLIGRRNRDWVPVIEQALDAAEAKVAAKAGGTKTADAEAQTAEAPENGAAQVVVAVGALHLPGQRGLLTLLAERGFTVTRLPL